MRLVCDNVAISNRRVTRKRPKDGHPNLIIDIGKFYYSYILMLDMVKRSMC